MKNTCSGRVLSRLFLPLCFAFIGALINVSNIYALNPKFWTLPQSFARNFDACVQFSDNQAAFISGMDILIQDLNTDEYDIYDLSRTDGWPADVRKIDAAMSWQTGELAFIAGNRMIMYDPMNAQVYNVAPWGLPGGWNGYDAGDRVGGGNYMLISQLDYAIYSPISNAFVDGGTLNWDGWPQNWNGGVNDILNIGDGFVYLFREGEVLVMDLGTHDYIGIGSINVIPEVTQQQVTNVDQNTTQQGGAGSDWCLVGGLGNLVPQKSPHAGVQNGTEFLDILPMGTRIAEVRVWGMTTITGIQFVTESYEGFRSETAIAGKGFGVPRKFELVPDECITGITGATGGPAGNFLYSLQFITNKRTSPLFGPKFGNKGQNSFSFRVPNGGSFFGLFGTYTASITSIGIQFGIDANVIGGEGDDLSGANTQMVTDMYFTGASTNKAGANEKEDPYFDQFSDFIEEKAWSVSDFQEKEIPAKDWLGVGIDALTFDPLEITKSDLPDKSRSIVLLTPSRVQCGPKSQWFKPYGAVDKSVQSGKDDSETTVTRNYGEFSNTYSINAHASVSTPYGGGSLSGSFSEMNSSSFGSEFICASREVIREYYQIELQYDWVNDRTGAQERQQLGFTFRNAVEKLPVPSSDFREIDPRTQQKGGRLAGPLERYRNEYMQFIKDFGTHWAYKVMFGGKYTVIEQVSRTEFENSRKTAMKFQAELNVKIKGFGGGAGGGYGNENSSTTGSSNENRVRRVKVSGGEGNTDFEQWSQAIASSPGPFDIEVKLISDFLSEVFFPFDEDIEKKQKLLKAFTYQYLLDNAKDPIPPVGNFFREVAARDCYYKVEITGINTNGHSAQLYGNLNIGAWSESGASLLNKKFWSKGGGSKGNVLNVGENQQAIGGTYYLKGKEGDLDRGKVAIWGSLKEYNSVNMGPANNDWDDGKADESYGSKTKNNVNQFDLFSLMSEGQSGDYKVTFGGPPGSIVISAKITRIPADQYR